MGKSSNVASRFPSSMPLDNGLETYSFLTMLLRAAYQLLWAKVIIFGAAHRNALGLRAATCCTVRINCPWSRCRRLNAFSSTQVSVAKEPSTEPGDFLSNGVQDGPRRTDCVPQTSRAWGISGSPAFGRRATNNELLYSVCPWNSVRRRRCCPPFDSGSRE